MTSGASAYGWEIPFLRVREVEIHHVDLDAGYTPDDWDRRVRHPHPRPARTVLPVAAGLPGGGLAATDGDGRWEVAAAGPTVTGPRSGLVGWLTGRTPGQG